VKNIYNNFWLKGFIGKRILCVHKELFSIHVALRKIKILVAVAVLYLPAQVFAAAGDLISNTATIDFVFQGVSLVQESSPTGNTSVGIGNGTATTFTEDRLVNFTVVSSDVAAVGVQSAETNAVLTFTVTNSGNAVQDFLLTAINTAPNPFGVPVDNIDTLLPLSVFVEDGTTPGYQIAEDTVVFIDELGITASVTVYVVADIPLATPGDLAAVALVVQIAAGGGAGEGAAISNDNNNNISPAGTYSNGVTNVPAGTASNISDTTGLEVVFNDPAGGAAEDVDSTGLPTQDVARNGQHSDAGAFVVQASPIIVVVNKTVTIIDTLGGVDPHPGATLRYELNVVITGPSNVNQLVITDPIPANTTYTPATIILNSVAQTDPDFATDGIDYSQFNGTDVIVDLSEGNTRVVTAADSPVIITFEVTID